MKYNITDVIECLSESTSDLILNQSIFTEGYKKDSKKKKLAQDYRDSKKKEKEQKIDGDGQTYVRKKLTDKEIDKLDKLAKIADKDDISEKSHRAAINMYHNTVGTPKDSAVKLKTHICGDRYVYNMSIQNNEISTRVAHPGKEIKLKPTDKLYHTTKVDNLTELKPTMKSRDGIHYANKRIYFYLNKTGSYMGGKAGTDDHVYELIDKPSVVKSDNELRGGGAVYIETDKPLRVKKIK